MTSNTGVYIHVPFCLSKCGYCDFYSVKFDEELADRYVNALIREIKLRKGFLADTVFFGGGTPSLLGAKRIGRIMDALSESLCIGCEITLECNPKTVDLVLLRDYYTAGINRLSIGVQSFCHNELVSLGRIHTAQDAEKTINDAYKAGFDNLSADFMLAVPGQTAKSLVYSLERVIKLGVPHISAYMLTIEPDTPFSRKGVRPAPDEVIAELYLTAVNFLESAGIRQYEISNFAKPGYECRHNLKYWKSEEYIGFGPAAHSFYGGIRYRHSRDLEGYILSGGDIIEVTDQNPGSFEEYAMLRLRLTEGLSIKEAEQKFGIDGEAVADKARPFEKHGLLKIENGRIFFTPRGFLVSNLLISEIVM